MHFYGQESKAPHSFEEELMARVAWFVRLRWFPAGVVLLVAILADSLERPHLRIPLGGLGLVILAYNTLFHLWLQPLKRAASAARNGTASVPYEDWRLFSNVQVAADWLALGWLVHCTGGYESPVIFYFLFHVLLASLLLSPANCYVQASVAVVLVTALTVAEYLGVLPHLPLRSPVPIPPPHDGLTLVGVLFCFASTLYFVAFLATSVSVRLRQREVELVALKDTLEQAHARMSTLHEVAKTISSTLDLDRTLELIVTQAAHTMRVEACSLRLLDESGQLGIRAAYGLSDVYLQKGPVELSGSRIDQEALRGRVVAVDVSAEGWFQYPEAMREEGIRSVLCAPLVTGERPVGVIRLYSREVRTFTAGEVEYLSHFANLAAIAIQNAQAYRTLTELDRSRSQFILTVAHELKSPLATAQSLHQVILSGYAGEVSEQVRDFVARSDRQLTLLLERLRDLLELAAREAGQAEKEWGDVTLNHLLARTLQDMQPRAEAKQMDLQAHIPADPLVVYGHAEDLERVFINLLSNAVKYTPDGGQVQLNVEAENGQVQVSVRDSGIGIAAENLPRLFDEFYRTPEARAMEKYGTGLGLAIVKRIVEAHGGRIQVASEPGQGSTFAVFLPLNLRDNPAGATNKTPTASVRYGPTPSSHSF
jgi:signal transduction histidine kinase